MNTFKKMGTLRKIRNNYEVGSIENIGITPSGSTAFGDNNFTPTFMPGITFSERPIFQSATDNQEKSEINEDSLYNLLYNPKARGK